jgi:hypothetical protein
MEQAGVDPALRPAIFDVVRAVGLFELWDGHGLNRMLKKSGSVVRDIREAYLVRDRNRAVPRDERRSRTTDYEDGHFEHPVGMFFRGPSCFNASELRRGRILTCAIWAHKITATHL